MHFATTPEEQQKQYEQLKDLASSAIGWAEGRRRAYGSIGAGIKVAAVLDAGHDLFNHTAYHGISEIYADTADGEQLRALISNCESRIKFDV